MPTRRRPSSLASERAAVTTAAASAASRCETVRGGSAPVSRLPGPERSRIISFRIVSGSAPRSRKTAIPVPSFRRTSPSRMCSVPM